MSRLRIATRGSRLALAQSRAVARRIEERLGVESELVEVRTSGDRMQNVSLAKIGGKGLFTKEIEEALLGGRADIAIHSAKDLPVAIPPGLILAAFPERADPRDALIGRGPDTSLEALPRGARVGTGSVRRASQLLAVRPDLEIVPLRGNVETRLRKLEEEDLHVVILACAGLDRLGLGDRIHERLSPNLLLPSVGQGTLAIQAMEGSGNLNVSLSRSKSDYTMEFADSGPGIPERDLEKVFEPFYTTRPSGSGLGLAIARRVVEDHGGEITIAAGKYSGTAVTVRLPVDRTESGDTDEPSTDNR